MTASAALSNNGKSATYSAAASLKSGLVLNSISCWIAWRKALEGMVPKCVQLPPTRGRSSTTATERPFLTERMAAPSPPGPDPMTTTSNTCFSDISEGLVN